MDNRHKWHKEIKAWADGAEIEACKAGIWFSTDYPTWHSNDYQFRIKPQPKEPQYLYFYRRVGGMYISEFPPTDTPHMCIGKIKLEVQDD
jgi:hypothetical protein